MSGCGGSPCLAARLPTGSSDIPRQCRRSSERATRRLRMTIATVERQLHVLTFES
jgi:hypothetical protein